MIVVSEIGEQWSPQTPPAMQEDMSTIIISGLFAVTASAIGMSIPNVPHDVPDAKPRAQDTRKNIAGIIMINPPGILSIILATNCARPRESVIVFRVHAIVRTRIGETIDLNPSGTHSISSEKGTTLLIM